MTRSCPHLYDPNACRQERRTRFAAARPDIRAWEENPCENCKAGRENETKSAEKRKEDQLSELKTLVMGVIEKRKEIHRRELTAAFEVSAAEIDAVAGTLAEEGTIMIRKTKGGGAIYALANSAHSKASGGRQLAGAAAAAGRVATAQAVPEDTGKIPPKNGGGRTESAGKPDLKQFRAIREKIDLLMTSIVHEDHEAIDDSLEEIAYVALDWRRERRAEA